MDTLKKAETISGDIIALRRRLHQVPEIGLRLPQTARIITMELDRLGIPWRKINDSYDGIVAEISRGKGKTVVFRADIDGLPIVEQTGLDFAAANGAMHACGHDCHAAILLGAARMFSEDESFSGTVRMIFQPAEETVGAARRMCEDGAMNNADAFFAVHVGNMVKEESGRLIITEGAVMASRDSFTITVTGKGCHGATPAEGKDPIVVSAYIITALQTMVSREIDGTDSAVLTIASIHSGDAYNVIPDAAVMTGSIRTLNSRIRQQFVRRLEELACGIAALMGAKAQIEWDEGMPVTDCDKGMTAYVRQTAERMFGKQAVTSLCKPLMSSEDAGYYLQRAKGCYFFFSTNPKGCEVFPNHNPHFMVDDSLLYKMSALFFELGIGVLDEGK